MARRADGTVLIYNDAVDARRYRPVERSDGWLVSRLRRPSAYDALIDRNASDFQLDPRLVKSVMLVESDFNPRAVSRRGARGLMQLMPETARRYGVHDVFDVAQNIRAGARYLNYLLNLFGGDLERALAAYNAGEGRVDRYHGVPPYDETVQYVHQTLTAYYGKSYLGGGFGTAFTRRYRLLTRGAPVHVERDADDNIVLTTAARSR